LPTAGRPDFVAVEGDGVVEAEAFHGAAGLAQLCFNDAAAGGARVDLDCVAFEGGGLHSDLAGLGGFDAGEPGVFPGGPAEGAVDWVVAVEVLEPDFVGGG